LGVATRELGKFLQFPDSPFILGAMIQPLALIAYEKLLPGSQLANRLQDLKYRVQVLSEPTSLVAVARETKPMLAIVDLVSTRSDICAAIAELRSNPETQHIPVIAFAPEDRPKLHESARKAGATLVTADTTIIPHLAQFLDQALQLE
jgi:CheY-like chemotaxis protein